jgi:hypothetical protein
MSKFEVVTTFSAEGYELYGRRMLASVFKHWPREAMLRVYSESAVVDHQRDLVHPFPQWLVDFRKRHAANAAAAGRLVPGRSRGQYNYKHDALRFAFKTAAVIDALERLAGSDVDYLIWVDADTVTHAPVTLGFLESLAPKDDQVISWLWRENNYPECGFYVLNLRHPRTATLTRSWRELYESDRLFHLVEWHDSYVLAECVRALQLSWRSISGAAAKTGHPFINGPLGAVMDHMKGNRKAQGRSNQHDLRVERTEPYWRRA